MEETVAKKNKLRLIREREIGFELVLSMVENYIEEKWGTGIGVPASVNTYTSARVLAELVWPLYRERETASGQDFSTFVYFNVKEKDLQEKIDFILEDLFSQKVAHLRGYARAGRPSVLSPLRRLAYKDWLAFNDFLQNYKQDYVTKQTKEENLLFTDENTEENIKQIIKIFLSSLSEKQKRRKRRRDAEKGGEEHRRQAQLFPVHVTPPESKRARKEDRANEQPYVI